MTRKVILKPHKNHVDHRTGPLRFYRKERGEYKTSDGYRVVTDRVELDLDNKSAFAPGHVKATGPRGAIEADQVTIDSNGGQKGQVMMRFEGNVRVQYDPAATDN